MAPLEVLVFRIRQASSLMSLASINFQEFREGFDDLERRLVILEKWMDEQKGQGK